MFLVSYFFLLENVFKLNVILFVDSDEMSMFLDKRNTVADKDGRNFHKTSFLELKPSVITN